RRLARCRRDLLDPALADLPVAATAARWGFANPTHFNRVFRDNFGHPPGKYRLTYNGSRASAAGETGTDVLDPGAR
ncbi:MAG: helix-turn-helix domain-containing protein, partial [Propionibacteriales bacterium]|nr:helix-turn-helix domain-containing protein [Propionibacteriales bacterium]